MFSLRRKSRPVPEPTKIRGSPSLPELNSQGIPWPESLVDVSSIRQDIPPISEHIPKGAAPISLQGAPHVIPFHKPFRPSGSGEGLPSISSLYMSNVPTNSTNGPIPRTASSKYSQRRARAPPTFNIMVVGGLGTGKTSLLRLLLETADLSPTATVDQRAAVDRFLSGSPKPTQSIHTACVEICESRYDRVLFSVIDSPGLDFVEGRELKLERQVSSVIKYIDAQYADTLSEESKVVRKNKGDQHIHLCIYLIDPSSIMTVAERRIKSSLPTKTRSETTVSYRTPPDLIPDTSSDSEDEESPLTMAPAEIRVIRRLAARCNVLPTIAKSDSLTDDALKNAKEAVRRSLSEAGLDFGIFGPPQISTPKKARAARFAGDLNDANNTEDEDEERQSRPVIKLRRPTVGRALSRSRSRRDLSQAAEDEHRPVSPDMESVASVRFSAHIVAKPDLTTLMPFALIAPEITALNRRNTSTDDQMLNTAPSSPIQQSEDGHALSVESSRRHSYLQGPPPDALKNVFIRKFRWGTVDVLDPDHCDFSALRTAVLSTHLKMLKVHTKEVLYEKYRTEKLLARRATSQITDEQRDRLLQDLGL
ncbi:septin family protein [Lentinula lateritia]|uniref:Septin family protein n=1 Tax=Lentinula aff. lateritia TaxID=2804960 RepID=A0ACC1U9E9_9AGAR|nr:septin family protein [Lentinula aff. lateritia]KAJ3853379.1 septin family protein [Lentinula lateritia]